MIGKYLSVTALIAASAASAALVTAAPANAAKTHDAHNTGHGHGVMQTNLVSDQPGKAQITDPI